jgi:hypothetical protein
MPPVREPEAKPEPSPFGVSDEPSTASSPAPEVIEPVGLPDPVIKPEPPKEDPWSHQPRSLDEADSSSIKQLELRAIFGVDRELTEMEILQRARSLPGIRQLARVAASEAGAVDSMKRLVKGLGFGEGQVKLYCGSAPIDFVREGPVMLAVQTDGGFGPGVRETLIIVARELSKV